MQEHERRSRSRISDRGYDQESRSEEALHGGIQFLEQVKWVRRSGMGVGKRELPDKSRRSGRRRGAPGWRAVGRMEREAGQTNQTSSRFRVRRQGPQAQSSRHPTAALIVVETLLL